MKKLFSYMMVCGAMMTAVLGFTSCEDELDVQQTYPFTVETMPVPKRIVKGETAEIRCEIMREGYFSDTRYTIRYFQPDGEGTLRMDDGMVLLPNDRYPLDRDVFRLYYTSDCEDQQTIDVYFEDNHDQVYQLTFTFNNEAKEISAEMFDKAVELIKEFEGWHSAKHYPYIGYGHKLLPHENLTADISEEQADSLLRADLLERYKYFRQYGKDALLLTVLAYNVGHSRLLGYGKRPKSNLIKKIESGDRDIYEEYISYRCYKGKPIPSIERRRKREFQLLYIP